MVIKATLFTLLVLLVLVVASSYYVNKEAFEDITDKAFASAVNTVSANPQIEQSAHDSIHNTGVQQTVPSESTTPQREDVTPEISISGPGYDAMTLKQKMDLLKDIQKVVRNEILAGRSTQPVLSGETRKGGQMTDATAQGQEYEGSCYKDTEYRCPKNPDGSCPPIPDMTQYIKKDAIPCWGCSLDY